MLVLKVKSVNLKGSLETTRFLGLNLTDHRLYGLLTCLRVF